MYLQDEWAILDNLTLEAGGRFDHYDNFGGTFNPRLGLIYQPFEVTTFKLLYGTAFRAPNAFESAYACCEGVTPWIGNPHLTPESIKTYEFVWEQRLNSNFDLHVSFYYNRLSNLINLTVSPEGIRQFHNQGNANAHGLETQLVAHFENIEGRLSHTFQQSRVAGAANPPNAPVHMIKFNISAPIWQNKLFAGYELQYISSRATTIDTHVPEYTTSNLTLLSRRLLPGLELTGGVYNLFDAHYFDPASPPLLPDKIAQDGRNFRIQMSYEF